MRKLALALLVAGLFLLPATASAQWLRFGLRPENERLGYFTYEVAPGALVTDALLAGNNSDEDIQLVVQPVDAGAALNGGLAFDMQDVGAGVAAWIDMPDAGTLTVPPGMAMRLPFTVRVPADAPPGEYAAGFLAVLADPKASTVSANPAETMSVEFIAQSAVALIVNVPGRLQRAMTIDGIEGGFEGGRWQLQVAMRNSGNVHFRGSGRVTLTTPDGERIHEQGFDVGYMAAGKSLLYPLTLDAPASGAYLAEVALTSEQGAQPLAGLIQSLQVSPPSEEETAQIALAELADANFAAQQAALARRQAGGLSEPQALAESGAPGGLEPWALSVFVIGAVAFAFVTGAAAAQRRQNRGA